MRQAFKPADFLQRARDRLEACVQTGSVESYTVAFRQRLLECADVTDTEALRRYVRGLKPDPQNWVRMASPENLHQAAQIAERYDSTFYKGNR